jgi:hypothetical protein
MSKPDWTEAPDQATHYDCSADVFCSVDGWWSCEGESYHMPFQTTWGRERYTPRPVEPAPTAWNGTGFPPVGTECEYWLRSGFFSRATVRYSGSSIIIVTCNGSELIVFVDDVAEQLRPIRTQAQIDRALLTETLNCMRKETDMGVIADAIIEMGFRITKP